MLRRKRLGRCHGDTEIITCFKTKGHHLDASLHTQFVLKNGGGNARCISAPDVLCSCIHSFAYGNAAMRTFGRARRRRPYAFCLDGLRVGRLMPFGWSARCISAPRCVLCGGVGAYFFNNTGLIAFLLSNSNVGGGYFFRRTSRPSYLQMASIHSSGMGMEWFSSRS